MELEFKKKEFKKICKENNIINSLRNNENVIDFAKKFSSLAKMYGWTWELHDKDITEEDVIRDIEDKLKTLCDKKIVSVYSGRIKVFKSFRDYDKKHIYFEILVNIF